MNRSKEDTSKKEVSEDLSKLQIFDIIRNHFDLTFSEINLIVTSHFPQTGANGFLLSIKRFNDCPVCMLSDSNCKG